MGANRQRFRLPGMVAILFSFIPWIIYWTLAGAGNSLGVTLGLAGVIILLLPQLRRRVFNFMDITSLLYFSLAALVTYGLDSPLFVKESGLLGYLALGAMATLSLLIKKPYTLQVAKKDYPEVYWRDPRFLLINQVITGIWALVFLASALIYLLAGFPLTVVASNALIGAGIVFSILFPRSAPAALATREFKRYDWPVPLADGPSPGENHPDVLVVGAGMGGLTAAALLARAGRRVLVLEQHSLPGGYCSAFRRRGFTFNTGVEAISGLGEKGPVRLLWRDLGLDPADFFVKNTSRYIFRSRHLDAPPDLEGLVAHLGERFPREAENLAAFFASARQAYTELYQEAEVYGAPLPAELIAKVGGPRALLDYPRQHPQAFAWMQKTYQEVLDEYFQDRDLQALLCALQGYLGTPPEKTPAAAALTAVVSYYLYGGYAPRGGALRLAEDLQGYIEDRGGRVLLRHRVDKILVEGGRVRGVQVGGETYPCPLVVANANARSTFLELVGEEHLDPGFAGYIRGLKMSPSVFMTFLGVDMDLSGYPGLIHDLDQGYGVVIGSQADPGLAPPGQATVTLIAAADHRDFSPRGTPEYRQEKERRARELVAKAERAIPGLSGHIVLRDTATPATLQRYTLMPEGAIYAFDQSLDTRRPYFKTPIPGLYLASASTFPGGGIEAVVIAGRICANDILGWGT